MREEIARLIYRGSALSVNPLFQLQARVTGNPHQFCSTNPINKNRYKKFTIHSAWFSQTINLLSLLATHNHLSKELITIWEMKIEFSTILVWRNKILLFLCLRCNALCCFSILFWFEAPGIYSVSFNVRID